MEQSCSLGKAVANPIGVNLRKLIPKLTPMVVQGFQDNLIL